MTWLRLTFRLQRPSIAFAAFVSLGLAGVAGWLAINMPAMLARCDASPAPNGCGTLSVFGSPIGQPVMLTQLAIGVGMYVVPLVLGAPALTEEIEQRTAMIAWPLAGSRVKWLAWRAGSVLVIGLVLIGIMAFASEQLARASDRGTDLGFLAHGSRGISLVVRSTLMFVAAVALGATIGRLLPSLLIGVAVALGLSTALDAMPPYGIASTELTLAESNSDEHPLQTGYGYRAPDGSSMTNDEAEAMFMEVFEEYSPELPPDSALPRDVHFGVAGPRYFEVLARESAVLIGATVLAAGVAAAVVQRRRPE